MGAQDKNLYRVEMSKPGCVFMVLAAHESIAARTAEKQWENWEYDPSIKAVLVELVGFGGQYPPKTGSTSSQIPWLLVA